MSENKLKPPYLLEHCEEIILENPSKWRISGHSKAGERTGIWLKPLQIVLDAGLGSNFHPKAIILSHSHCDHTLALPNLISPRSVELKGQEMLFGRPIFMPEGVSFKVQKQMEAVMIMSDNHVDFPCQPEKVWERMKYHPFEVKPADTFEIPGIKDLEIEALHAYHNTASLGYGFLSKKRKLKHKFLALSKDELVDARKRGEELMESVSTPEMAFYCDSTIDNLLLHSEWKKYPVILCECTGYPGRHSQEQMRERFHTHLNDLLPIMESHRDKQWILLHASSAMKDYELMKIEQEIKEKYSINVHIMVDR